MKAFTIQSSPDFPRIFSLVVPKPPCSKHAHHTLHPWVHGTSSHTRLPFPSYPQPLQSSRATPSPALCLLRRTDERVPMPREEDRRLVAPRCCVCCVRCCVSWCERAGCQGRKVEAVTKLFMESRNNCFNYPSNFNRCIQ